jgi:hypothetical protein
MFLPSPSLHTTVADSAREGRRYPGTASAVIGAACARPPGTAGGASTRRLPDVIERALAANYRAVLLPDETE